MKKNITQTEITAEGKGGGRLVSGELSASLIGRFLTVCEAKKPAGFMVARAATALLI